MNECAALCTANKKSCTADTKAILVGFSKTIVGVVSSIIDEDDPLDIVDTAIEKGDSALDTLSHSKCPK